MCRDGVGLGPAVIALSCGGIICSARGLVCSRACVPTLPGNARDFVPFPWSRYVPLKRNVRAGESHAPRPAFVSCALARSA